MRHFKVKFTVDELFALYRDTKSPGIVASSPIDLVYLMSAHQKIELALQRGK